MKIRSEVAGILRQYKLKNLENEFEAEELTAKQNFEVSTVYRCSTKFRSDWAMLDLSFIAMSLDYLIELFFVE